MSPLLIIPALAVLNRMRGDDRWLFGAPGRALWYVAPLVGLLCGMVMPWQPALVWMAGYLFWAIPGWGRWYDLGRLPPEPEYRSVFEQVVDTIGFGNDHLCFFIRNLLVAPTAYALAVWYGYDMGVAGLFTVGFALAVVLLYELAWRVHPSNPIWVAELAVGALWGSLIVWSVS